MHDTPLGDGDRSAGGPDEGADILASIRRIVSEEDTQPALASGAPRSRGDAVAAAATRISREAPISSEAVISPEAEDEAEPDVFVLTAALRVEAEDDADVETETPERPYILRGPTAEDAAEDDDPAEAARDAVSGLRLRDAPEPPPTRADDAASADWTRALDGGDDDADAPEWIRTAPAEEAKGRNGRVTPLRRSTPHPASPLRGRDGARREEPQRPDRHARDEDEDADGSLFADRGDAAAAGTDRDALEELIRATLREELSGPMGDRISANIRRMVQREVRKAVEEALSVR